MALHTVGLGEITYECRAEANTAGALEWVFVGSQATLQGRTCEVRSLNQREIVLYRADDLFWQPS